MRHLTDGNEGEQARDHGGVRNTFTEAGAPSWATEAAVCIDLKLISQGWKKMRFPDMAESNTSFHFCEE